MGLVSSLYIVNLSENHVVFKMAKTALFGKRKNITADMKELGDGALKALEIFRIFQISLIFSFQLLRRIFHCFLIKAL